MFVFYLASVRPDFAGMPAEVHKGLIQVTDNAAAVLLLVSGLAIASSLIGLVLATWSGNRGLAERSSGMLVVGVGALALLYLGTATVNYTAGLFA